jgi:hypothetical protein
MLISGVYIHALCALVTADEVMIGCAMGHLEMFAQRTFAG